MEPEPDAVDLSILDPKRDGPRFERAVADVASRARELYRLRRVVVRRAITAAALVAAASVALWLSRPHREPPRTDVLSWAMPDARPDDVLTLGGAYAQ